MRIADRDRACREVACASVYEYLRNGQVRQFVTQGTVPVTRGLSLSPRDSPPVTTRVPRVCVFDGSPRAPVGKFSDRGQALSSRDCPRMTGTVPVTRGQCPR